MVGSFPIFNDVIIVNFMYCFNILYYYYNYIGDRLNQSIDGNYSGHLRLIRLEKRDNPNHEMCITHRIPRACMESNQYA